MANASYEIIVDTSKAVNAINGLNTALATLATGKAAAGIAQIMDNATNLSNRLSMVTQTGQNTQQAFDLMAKSALTLGVPLKDVGNLFFRIANNTKDLGLTQKEQLRVTELLNKSFQTTGATASEAASASLQFSQALAAGTLRGDELNSILENAPGLAQALAASLGVTTGALKEMGKQGELTADKVIKGFIEGGAKIDSDFAKRLPTIDQSLTQLSNTFDILVAQFDKATGSSATISAALIELAITMVELKNAFTGQGDGGPFKEFVDSAKTVVTWLKYIVEFAVFVYAPFRIIGAVFGAATLAIGTTSAELSLLGSRVGGSIGLWDKFKTAIVSIGTVIFPSITAAFKGLADKFGIILGPMTQFGLMFNAIVASIGVGLHAIGAWTGLSDWITKFFDTNKAKKEADELKKTFGVLQSDQNIVGPPKPEEETRLQHLQKLLGIDVAQALNTATEKTGGLDAAQQKLKGTLNSSTEALAKQYAALHNSLTKETAGIGNSPEAAEYAKTRTEALNKYDEAVTAFKEKQKQMNVKDDSPVVAEGMKKLGEERDKALAQLDKDVAAKIGATRANDQFNYSLQELQNQTARLTKLQQEYDMVGLTPIQKKYKEIENSANAAADAQMAAVAKQRGMTVQQLEASDPKAAAAIHEAAAASIDKERQAVEKLNAAQIQNDMRMAVLKHQYDQQATLRKLQDDINKTTLSETERKYYDIGAAADEAAKAEIRLAAEKQGIKPEELPIEQVKAYYAANFEGIDQLIAKTKELQAAQEEQLRKAFVLKEHNANLDKLQAIQDEIAKSSMTEIEKKYYDIDAAARQSAESELRALAARQGMSRDQLDAETVKDYYKAAYQGTQELKGATQAAYANSRTFATGWKQALNSYTEDATNAANQASRLFKTTTQGMEDMIVKFAKTGKFEWKGFLSSIVEELLRSQITVLLSNILNGGSSSGGSGGGLFGGIASMLGLDGNSGIGGAISSMFGGGGSSGGKSGGVMGTYNNPMYVIVAGSQAGSTMNGVAKKGNNILGNVINAVAKPAQSGTSWWDDITGGISDFFSGNTGKSSYGGSSYGVLQDDQNSGSSIWDDVGDFFGGLFATGGNLPAGKWGIAGESGPELIRGPASISSASQTASDLGSTNVTYNINAVDAQSFKAMIAADPSFIYAVTMQGARGMPKR